MMTLRMVKKKVVNMCFFYILFSPFIKILLINFLRELCPKLHGFTFFIFIIFLKIQTPNEFS